MKKQKIPHCWNSWQIQNNNTTVERRIIDTQIHDDSLSSPYIDTSIKKQITGLSRFINPNISSKDEVHV